MPISTLSANMVVQWVLARSNAPFAATKQGPDGIEYNLSDLSAIFNQVYAADLSVGPSSTTTIDLTSLTNLVNESLNFSAVLFLFAVPTVEGVVVGPGASNGLQIFGGTSTVTVPQNGGLFWGGDPAGTGLAVSGTHKTLAFQNTSGGTLSLDLVIAGKAP